MDTNKSPAAFDRMIAAAVSMAQPLEILTQETQNTAVIMSQRLNPIVRKWQREQNRRRLQAYLNTRRTSRRK